MELIYTRDGDQVRSYDWAGLEVAWDTATGERLDVTQGAPIYWDVELTKDAQLGAMACSAAYVFRFSEKTDARSDLYVLVSDGAEVTGVAFNPEGTVLATSSSNGLAKLWDMETGEEIATLSDRKSSLGGVDFSPDGRYLVTAGSDGTVSVYSISIEELMEVARSRLSRGLTLEECRTYLHLPLCPNE